MRTKAMRGLVAAGLAALLLGACSAQESGPGATTTDDLDDIYTAAKQEGEVVIYGPGETIMKPVYKKFMAKYPGVKVTTVAIFGPELDARLQANQAGGGDQADLVHNGVPDESRYRAQGILDELKPANASSMPAGVVDDENGWVVPSQTVFGLMYNTKTTKAASVPKTWDGLVDPALKGKLTVSDFTVAGGCAAVMSSAHAADAVDEAWLKALRDDVDPLVFSGTIEATNAVVTGEAEVQMCANYNAYVSAKAQGAPLGFSFSEDGVYLQGFPYAQLKGAKNPNASRLLVTWLLSDEGQQALADTGSLPSMPDAPKPNELSKIDQYKVIEFPGLDTYAKDVELFGQYF